MAGCVPVPVSTVPLYPREERPVVVESALVENYGIFSVPAFDTNGNLLAVYDSGSNLVKILRSADLKLIDSFKPLRRPRRLSFSPSSRYLVIEAHQGWVDDFLSGKGTSTSHVDIDSPEAIKDNIQRAEVFDLHTGQTISNLACDAVVTSEPEGGWLWARRWAITPGYRSSVLLEAHFSVDETEFTVLCWNGVQQRWNSRTWQRLDDVPPPPFWDPVMGLGTVKWLAKKDPASGSADGQFVLLQVREKHCGFPAINIWDRNTSQTLRLPGACANRLQPIYALSRDGNRIVVACNKDLGYAVQVWDLGLGEELPLEDAKFGLIDGIPTLRSEGVALSPDGRYLAVALLGQMEYLLPNLLLIPAGISRSDLRVWDLMEGTAPVTVPIDELEGGTTFFRGVELTFSPDSQTLVVAGRRLRLYQMRDLAACSHDN